MVCKSSGLNAQRCGGLNENRLRHLTPRSTVVVLLGKAMQAGWSRSVAEGGLSEFIGSLCSSSLSLLPVGG